MCLPDGDVLTSEADSRLGEVNVPGLDPAVPSWMSASQYECWKTHPSVYGHWR